MTGCTIAMVGGIYNMAKDFVDLPWHKKKPLKKKTPNRGRISEDPPVPPQKP
jgi:hypothetical protein